MKKYLWPLLLAATLLTAPAPAAEKPKSPTIAELEGLSAESVNDGTEGTFITLEDLDQKTVHNVLRQATRPEAAEIVRKMTVEQGAFYAGEEKTMRKQAAAAPKKKPQVSAAVTAAAPVAAKPAVKTPAPSVRIPESSARVRSPAPSVLIPEQTVARTPAPSVRTVTVDGPVRMIDDMIEPVEDPVEDEKTIEAARVEEAQRIAAERLKRGEPLPRGKLVDAPVASPAPGTGGVQLTNLSIQDAIDSLDHELEPANPHPNLKLIRGPGPQMPQQ